MARISQHNKNAAIFDPRQVVSRVQKAWGESPFYQSRLKGPAPDRLCFEPPDPYAPDKAFAQSFAKGSMTLGDETIDCEGELATLWDRVETGGPLYRFLHEFSWMRHLNALGEAGIAPARVILGEWLARYEKWAPDVWEPSITSQRLLFLSSYAPLVLTNTDALWRSRVLSSMARQTRHLARSAHRATTGFDRLAAASSLAVVGYCLPGCENAGERGLELVRRETRLQLLPDGGHVSRNPSRQLVVALGLQTILKTLAARKIAAPGYLRHVAGRASAIAQFFRCGDGQLAVFNGGQEDDGRAVLAARSFLDEDAIPAGFARHAGYQRLGCGRSLVIVDVSAKTKSSGNKFESAGSFHFSSGRNRIVGNCGNGGHLGADWRSAMTRNAAHSTLSFEGGGYRLILGETSHARAEDIRGQLVEFECDIVSVDQENARYVRRLYLAAGGGDLRGEEQLRGADPAVLQHARWRFHLHPSVRASLARDRKSVLLALPGREGWRFRANSARLALKKSVYCGGGAAPQTTEQIVLSADDHAPAAPVFRLKWAFKRLAGV